ncbi:hypothetical protein C8R43DRAFT_971974 [Mycena crocata]|nr:hypothetical protein C8R43DRAFT_971974 [Mycena crocata]
MKRDRSYRKPAPTFIPSPPPSPVSAGHQDAERPPLPEHWHDAIAQARKTLDNFVVANQPPERTLASFHPLAGHDVLPGPFTLPAEIPRVASPVYFASTLRATRAEGQHQVYRPPTPPRRAACKRPRLDALDTTPDNVLNARFNSCRSDGIYARSIETTESSSRQTSWISLPYEWQVAQFPDARDNGQSVWWEKMKMLGVLMKSRMKRLREYGALC